MTVTVQKWRSRILLGGILGVAFYLLLSFLTQPGSLFGGSLEFAFTFCYDGRVPEWLGAALGSALWFAFGAEKLGQGKEKVRALLDETPELRNAIESQLIEHLGMNPRPVVHAPEETLPDPENAPVDDMDDEI